MFALLIRIDNKIVLENLEEPGQKLRRARERLGLKYRDVREASHDLASAHGNNEFIIGLSRLADIETKGTVPSLFRMYTLCVIYKLNFGSVLRWYGINLENLATDARHFGLNNTSVFDVDIPDRLQLELPLKMRSDFDLHRTSFLGHQIEVWGKVSIAMLAGMHPKQGRYGFLGTEDWSMWPLIPPGSFLQIDERKNKPGQDSWSSEYDRPIYLVEHREGFFCGWCSVRDAQLIVQSHPSHGAAPRIYKYPGEVDIIGQVIGIATRMGQVKPHRTHSSTTQELLQNRRRASSVQDPEWLPAPDSYME